MRGGLLAIGGGLWLLVQVFAGNALGRLGLVGAAAEAREAETAAANAGPAAPAPAPGAALLSVVR